MTAKSLVGGHPRAQARQELQSVGAMREWGDTPELKPGRNCRVWVLWGVGNQEPGEGRRSQADTEV